MTFLFILCFVLGFTTVWFFIPWLKRDYAIRKWKIKNLTKISPIEECHCDKLGNKWYKYKNLLNMPPKRGIAAEIASRQADLCLTTEMFDRILVEMRAACNQSDLTTVAGFIDRLRERRTWAGEEDTIKKLANVYFLLEGEECDTVSEYWFEKKKEIWAKDPDTYVFFLKEAFSCIRSLKDLSEADFLSYLRGRAVENSLMMQSLSESL